MEACRSPVGLFRISAIGYNRTASMPDSRFPSLVSLACHDLRTPLATVYGFARTLTRAGELDPRSARFVAMIEEASEQMTELLDELGTAARIESGRWEPVFGSVNTLDLARAEDERIAVDGDGELVDTDVGAVRRSLAAFALAAIRHGRVEHVAWRVAGRSFELSPVREAAAAVVTGAELKDLGALVGRLVIEELGGAVELDGETLRVRL
jgi:signal transduction histidine kinase